MNNTEFDRLKEIADKYFGNLSKLAEKVGRHRNFFHNYRNKKLGRTILDLLEQKAQISSRYITLNELPIFLDVPPEPKRLLKENNIVDINSINSIDLMQIIVYAGRGVIMSDEPIGKINLEKVLQLSTAFIWRCESNELKEYGIESNDLVIIQKTQKIYEGNIVLFRYNNNEYIKGLIKVKNGSYYFEDGSVSIIAENEIEIIGVINHLIKKVSK